MGEHHAKTIERAKKEKTHKEKQSKERKAKEMTKKEKDSKESAKKKEQKNKESAAKEKAAKEKAAKEKAKKEKDAKEKAKKEKAKKEKAKKEIKAKGDKHKSNKAKAAAAHAKNVAECNTHAATTANSGKTVTVHLSAVKAAVKEAKATCKREKKRKAEAAAAKAKLAAEGPTFNFKSPPCKGGQGSFTKKMKHNQRVNVGQIPAMTKNVEIQLRTDKDVDAELWTYNGKREIAIVAWNIGKIDSPTKANIQFNGATINYSGYNGITTKSGMNFGHEDIGIKGQCKSGFTMKAYAFQAGTAKITYKWGADPIKCKAAMKKKRAEKKAKHDAKIALKKKMHEGSYKAALKVLAGGKGCAGANKWTASSRDRLTKAEATHNNHKAALAKCSKKQAKSKKHFAAMAHKEKSFKKSYKSFVMHS